MNRNLSVPEFMDGWRSSDAPIPEKYTTNLEDETFTLVLIAVPRHYDYPVTGYYMNGLGWRIVGSPSDFTDDVVAWQPLPRMPFTEEA
jgi:hypothetical protein